MAEVVLEKVSRIYPPGTLAVDRVDLEVPDRELLVLVGPSGCGKTTLLRLVAGLEKVSEGTIRIGDRVVNGMAPRDRDVAMVFQNHALYPHLTVGGNMAFGLKLRYGGGLLARGLRRVFRPRKAAELASRRRTIGQQVETTARALGIEPLLERMPGQLSGGERQRVALGRALVRRPAAFLFDEPLSNLDAALRVELRREIKRLHQRLQATTIYVTHDQAEALTLGQRVAVMRRGAIQQVGPALEVYDKPRNRFVAGFLGTPAMNFIEGELIHSDGRWRFEAGAFTVELSAEATRRQAPSREVTLGIRPEHVSVGSGSGSARVVLVEPLGDATLAHLRLETSEEHQAVEIVSKVGARLGVKPGERVPIELDGARAHLFDRRSGENLAD